MKRYVKEFANDIFRDPSCQPEMRKEIENILKLVKSSTVTNFEAIRHIVEIKVKYL